MKRVVLGVCAHPDDLEFAAAGTVAKFTKVGADCYYLICTNGCKGTSDARISESKLIRIRREEQRNAGRIIGLKNVFFLDNNDTELVAGMQLKKDIVRYIRMLKPDTVIASDPSFIYSDRYINHADHRAAGLAAMDAVYPLARDRLTFRELEKEGLKPHKVKELLIVNSDRPNYFVDISSTMGQKIKALAAHKSQISKSSIEFAEKRAKELGKKNGCRYAEAFFRIRL
jgi:LmbE family N-acetylglucosaminyl deacetylase